ncbi:UNVERIFIED_CONTAM: hypothetical protein FKN15_060297 [Acipenser sinensis]
MRAMEPDRHSYKWRAGHEEEKTSANKCIQAKKFIATPIHIKNGSLKIQCLELLEMLPNKDSYAAEMDNDESDSEADWVCEDESSSSSDIEGAGDPVGEEAILWQPLQGYRPLHLHQPLHLIQPLLHLTSTTWHSRGW